MKKYPVNNKSFFATKASVGAYWRKIKKAKKEADEIKGTGALQRKVVSVPFDRPVHVNKDEIESRKP